MNKIFTRTVLAAALVLVVSAASASDTKYKKLITKADRYYEGYVFLRAVDLYRKAFEQSESFDAYAALQIADSYRLMNKPINAEEWYAQLGERNLLSEKDLVNYSTVLLENGRQDKAKEIAESIDVESKVNSLRLKEISKIQNFYLDSAGYTMNHLEINSDQNDFAPAFYEDGVVFASNRKTKRLGQNTYYWDNTFFLDLFYADLSGEEEVRPITGKINTVMHEGPAVFFYDDNQVIFTRNNFHMGERKFSDEGVNLLNLYEAKRKKNGKWSKATPMKFNGDNFSTGHPTLSADGKTLYFSSDRPGTQGKADIYKSTLIDGEWSEPMNMGALINTMEDELFPYIDKDNILYFASEGHPGIGGLDVYRIDLKAENPEVINMGYPVNTPFDDFGLIVNGNRGFVASNREGGYGSDDIYEVAILRPVIKTRLVDEETKELVSGHIKAVNTKDNRVVLEEDGVSESMVRGVLRGRTLVIDADSEGYEAKQVSFNSAKIPKGQREYTLDILLASPKVSGSLLLVRNPGSESVFTLLESVDAFDGSLDDVKQHYNEKRIDLQNIYEIESILYDFDKSHIRPDAAEKLDRLVAVLKQYPELSIKLSSHTDSRGSKLYNERLAKRRATSAKAYILGKGIAGDRVEIGSFGEEQLVNDCFDGVHCDDDTHETNRRTEVSVRAE